MSDDFRRQKQVWRGAKAKAPQPLWSCPECFKTMNNLTVVCHYGHQPPRAELERLALNVSSKKSELLSQTAFCWHKRLQQRVSQRLRFFNSLHVLHNYFWNWWQINIKPKFFKFWKSDILPSSKMSFTIYTQILGSTVSWFHRFHQGHKQFRWPLNWSKSSNIGIISNFIFLKITIFWDCFLIFQVLPTAVSTYAISRLVKTFSRHLERLWKSCLYNEKRGLKKLAKSWRITYSPTLIIQLLKSNFLHPWKQSAK